MDLAQLLSAVAPALPQLGVGTVLVLVLFARERSHHSVEQQRNAERTALVEERAEERQALLKEKAQAVRDAEAPQAWLISELRNEVVNLKLTLDEERQQRRVADEQLSRYRRRNTGS